MEHYIWILLTVLIVIVGLACTIYFSARYFFRLTILRKPTATLETNTTQTLTGNSTLILSLSARSGFYSRKWRTFL